MPRFLDTRGLSDIAIAVCDRCKMKRAHAEMRPDPNFPGLQVCGQGCADEKDPYRLPARKTERITIRFPRPDVSLTDPVDLPPIPAFLMLESGAGYLLQETGSQPARIELEQEMIGLQSGGNNNLITGQYLNAVISTQQNIQVPSQNGNLDGIEV